LKLAVVAEAAEERVVLALPSGPGLEALSSDPRAHAAVERALSGELGRTLSLEIRPIGGGPAQTAPIQATRLTPEGVRAEQLSRLVRDQPVLAEAVRAWDLELE
jgi:hypothetical protein